MHSRWLLPLAGDTPHSMPSQDRNNMKISGLDLIVGAFGSYQADVLMGLRYVCPRLANGRYICTCHQGAFLWWNLLVLGIRFGISCVVVSSCAMIHIYPTALAHLVQ